MAMDELDVEFVDADAREGQDATLFVARLSVLPNAGDVVTLPPEARKPAPVWAVIDRKEVQVQVGDGIREPQYQVVRRWYAYRKQMVDRDRCNVSVVIVLSALLPAGEYV